MMIEVGETRMIISMVTKVGSVYGVKLNHDGVRPVAVDFYISKANELLLLNSPLL